MIIEKRLTHINNIELFSPLHIKEFYNPKPIIEKNINTINGGFISFKKRVLLPKRSAYSYESGWLSLDNKEAILELYNTIGNTVDLKYTDNSIEKARFNHEAGIKFMPLFEGSIYYKVEINFILVESN